MCSGSESSLLECLSDNDIGSHDCSHSEDAGVRCEGVTTRFQNNIMLKTVHSIPNSYL